MLTLTVLQRQNLKARAHVLKPVVIIGTAGLTGAVLAEIARALKSHELIKISAQSGEREERKAMMEQICAELDAAPVQHIGKTLIIYQPQEPTPKNPTAKRLTKKAAARH